MSVGLSLNVDKVLLHDENERVRDGNEWERKILVRSLSTKKFNKKVTL